MPSMENALWAPSENPRRNRFIDVIAFLTILTSSFDVFLNAQVHGFSIRATEFLSLILIVYGLFQALRRWRAGEKVVWPLAFGYLALWTLFILIFIPHTTALTRSIGYGLWLVFSVVLVFSFVQIYHAGEGAVTLLKMYILSFFLLGLFGLIQFLLPMFDLGAPFITQWWVPGVAPRVNGFSYEPSYYATYMLSGWILIAYFLEKRVSFMSSRFLWIALFVSTAAMILCSSRMGWLMMVLWCLRYPFMFFKRIHNKEELRRILLVALALVVGIALGGLLLLIALHGGIIHGQGGADKKAHLKVLGRNLGVDGSSSSLSVRLRDLRETLLVFWHSPFIGYSLGGIAPAIGKLHQTVVGTQKAAHAYEGMSIFAQVLAASGIIGAIPFVVYVLKLMIKPFLMAYQIADKDVKASLRGATYALAFAFAILQMNQNILRSYLWLSIAVLSVVVAAAARAVQAKGSR